MVLDSLSAANSYSYTSQTTKDKSKTNNPNAKITIKDPKTGKTYTMTKEQFIAYLRYIQNKNNTKPADPYDLGEEANGIRTITEDCVTISTKPGSSAPKDFYNSPNKYDDFRTNITEDNGLIDEFRQGKRGDCYLLSSIEAIRNTKDGQKILQKNVQHNPDGSYTITLPGAVLARKHYIDEGHGDKCAITGRYTITKEALEKAQSQSGKAYSFGDINVILFELAMEAFKAEVYETNKALGQKSQEFIAGQLAPGSLDDPLAGGQMYDAIFLLTGQKSDVYDGGKEKRQNCKLYTPGEYGYVGEEEKRLLGITANKKTKKEDLIEVNNVYNKDSDLQRLLDKYAGKEDQYCITVGVRVAKKGPDGSTQAGGGHALTVTKITDKYVEVANPWDTGKRERIPRADFEKMAVHLTVTEMSEKKVDKFYDKNVNNTERKGFLDWLFGTSKKNAA